MKSYRESIADKVQPKILPTFNLKYQEEYLDAEMLKLHKNIFNLYYNKPLTYAYQDLYIMVENLCTLDKTEEIYNALKILIEDFLNVQHMDLIYYEKEHFLRKLKELWLLFCHKSKIVKNIYLYLEIDSIRNRNSKISIWQMCLQTFQNIILCSNIVKEKLNHLYKLIEDERNDHIIDNKLLNDIIQMFEKLALYETYFETKFLLSSKEYYIEKRDTLIEEDILEYFYYVKQKLNEEKIRVTSFLKSVTDQKLANLLHNALIEEKLELLMTKLESTNIFVTAGNNDIITIYDLLVILPKANEDFCKIFSNYIMKTGTEIVFDNISEQNLIGNLLNFKDRVDNIVQICFKSNKLYVEAVRDCFKKFINKRKYKPAQFLAKFIDVKMRDKLIPEKLLDKIMVVFRFIQGKDVFEAYYKRYLSKRLLLGKSSSQDAEKYMISKLKLECGDGFTAKLEGMFRDIDMSDSLITSFKQRPSNSNVPIEFTAHVLTSSFWPTFTKHTVTLSDKMLKYLTVFQDFYRSKYSGRSLQWISALGSCLIKATLKNGNKEFQVSLYQALVLLLFNETDKLTFKSIKLYLNLNDAELIRTLCSLSRGKVKILIKTPDVATINENDDYCINDEFTNKLFRIKINQLQFKETEEEQRITEEEVMHDRHLQIDAALVRLMKQHQKMRHNDLIAKIYTVLKFPVNPNDIKKRIEILIERDFLTRNPDDANSYLYVA